MAWNLTKDGSKKEVNDEAKTSCAALHFVCIINGHMSFENAELEAKHQQYKGRVALSGDIVKDDSGSYAVY